MPNAFNFSAAPFDGLTPEQQQLVRENVDIVYYPEGATVLSEGDAVTHLHIVIKGHVQQFDHEELVCVYSPDDCFDGRSLIAGRVTGTFIAAEELIVYVLPKTTVNQLIAENASFSALLFSDMSQKLSALTERHSQRQLHSLMSARIHQAFVRPAIVVDGTTDVFTVAQMFQAKKLTNVLVNDDQCELPRIGIFTSTDIRKAVLADTDLRKLPIAKLATYQLIEAENTESVFDALILMIRHGVHRLIVREHGKITGVLEQLDLMSFISNHSHLIWLQIQQSNSLDELKIACGNIHQLISLLTESGVKVGMIARMVQELNHKVFNRLWEFVAPQELILNSCVLVMGSEGRGEQILKTDQDNALIIKDGFEYSNVEKITQDFNDALCDFGYPPCPGGIMMKESLWCQSLTAFKQTVKNWILEPNSDSFMNLAIFIDAVAVCGDHHLLEELRDYMFSLLQDNAAFFARFVKAADSFGEPAGWWTKILRSTDENDSVDIKKLGIFPVVHGIRGLALESRVRATSTLDRIEALVRLNKLPRDHADELLGALQFFMGLRLKQGLSQIALERKPSSQIHLSKLSSLEKDLLKDSLQIIKQFKTLLRYHFKLDAV